MKTSDSANASSNSKTTIKGSSHKRQASNVIESKSKKVATETPPNQRNSSAVENVSSPEKNSVQPPSKLYAGISSKFVKCIWEQHDKSDMEISHDVFLRLSEDVTYKLWELANTMKTYARHSGGNVTVDIVNEILKDSNVPPILGAFDGSWDKIEYDRTYYFQTETLVDLSKEYSKDIEIKKKKSLELSTMWCSDKNITEKLIAFSASICEAIFTGNSAEVAFGLDMTYSHPQIGCITKILLKKCIEMLAINYTHEMLERSLMLLCALAANHNSRDADINAELYLLAELLICLLLGPNLVKLVTPPPEQPVFKTMEKQSKNLIKKREDEVIPKIFTEVERANFNTPSVEIKPEVEVIKAGKSRLPSPELTMEITEEPDIPNSEYEKLFAIMKEIKNSKEDVKKKMEDIRLQMKKPEEDTITNIYTKICKRSSVDLLCKTIGGMSGRWGLAEEYLLLSIEQRIDIFFQKKIIFTLKDYDWLCRLLDGLWALGEAGFRKILIHTNKLDPSEVPTWLQIHLNACAIFLKGTTDIKFYNWIYGICGDSILPFSIYYQKFLQKLSYKTFEKTKTYSFKICPNVKICSVLKKTAIKKYTLTELFPDNKVEKKSTTFSFRFAGCRPINSKWKRSQTLQNQIKQHETITNSLFGKKTVIGKRRSMKILTNQKHCTFCNDVILFNL